MQKKNTEDFLKSQENLTRTEIITEEKSTTAKVSDISSAVVNGNTCYYIMLEGEDKIFIADIGLNDALPFINKGDKLSITYTDNDGSVVAVKVETVK